MDNPFRDYYNLLNKNIKKPAIIQLWNYWNESFRKYHNISHLSSILSYLYLHRSLFSYPQSEALILAAFFHDAIYDPKNPVDNVKKSIEFFKKSSLKSPPELSLLAIRSTDFRKIPSNLFVKVFWEADNQIFKKPWKDYIKWEKAIRSEYSYFNDDIYKKNRINFLKTNFGLFGSNADIKIRDLINLVKNKYKEK